MPILLLLAALLAVQLFPQIRYTKEATWYILLTIFTIKALVEIAVETRITSVIIDTANRKLQISYYDLVTGNQSEIYPFEKVRLRFDDSSKNGEVRRIYVKAGKHADYTISTKDGFSSTLNELRNQLERLTSPVNS